VIRSLECKGQFTTTVENLRDAFNSTLGLATMGVMTEAIQRASREIRPDRGHNRPPPHAETIEMDRLTHRDNGATNAAKFTRKGFGA